jgi:predicted HicB family RNase H-like nuclease
MTDAQKRARDKYLSEKVEDVKFRVPKGKKEVIQKCATQAGESVNAFINRVIDEAIEKDSNP